MKNNTRIYIGISGVARSGKNLFADLATRILSEKYKLTTKSFSLAYYLKKDCEDFVKEKLGLSVWSELTEEKDVFRPLLVWYAGIKRKQTQGRYWIEKLQPDILKSECDVNIITDIRFSVYDKDETFWLKNELGGKIIHVSKYTSDSYNNKKFVPPANDQESLNDPMVRRMSDYLLEWEDSIKKNNGTSYAALLNDSYLIECVDKAISSVIIDK